MGDEPDIFERIEAELRLDQIKTKLRDARDTLGRARSYATDNRNSIRRGQLSASEVFEELYLLADPEGSLIYSCDKFLADLEAVQQTILELPAPAAKEAEAILLKVQKTRSDVQDVSDALKHLEGEMEIYGATKETIRPSRRHEKCRIFKKLTLAVPLRSYKTRALKATALNEVAELQKQLGSVESIYNELLSAAPQSEETRSIEFELRIGNFRRTVDELDAEIGSKCNEWRQRFGISDSASHREFLDQLPPELWEAVQAMQPRHSKILDLPNDFGRLTSRPSL
jgi:hypothetical protein